MKLPTKLPVPTVMDTIQFHSFVAIYYAQLGLQHFAQLHTDQLLKLTKMHERVYELEQKEQKIQLNKKLSQLRQIFDQINKQLENL